MHVAQPRHTHVIDLEAALADSEQVLALWFKSRNAGDAPLFSGGCLDSWPAWALDAFGICRSEEVAVDDFLRAEAAYA